MCKQKKRTIPNRPWSDFELKLTTVHCKCSQTHRVSLSSSSQNLAAKCASKRNELYRIVHGQISNLSLQQFTASARKHTEYLYPVVHKTSLQSVQAIKKELYRIVDRQISNLSFQQFTASARKHTEYLYPVVHKTSLQSVQAIKKELYRIVDRQISNLSFQQFTASARKHTEYLYPVVHKTSLQSVQAIKKELYRIVDRQISNLSFQQFTASARKHTEYLYPVGHKTSLQSVQAKKKKRTISNRPWSNFELKLTTIHYKCSQTHQVTLPSSSQNLAAKCASQKKKTVSVFCKS